MASALASIFEVARNCALALSEAELSALLECIHTDHADIIVNARIDPLRSPFPFLLF